MISHRYARANNSYLEDLNEYNPAEPHKFITYYDCNNLYGKSMQQPLPITDFHFMSDDEIDVLMKNNTLENHPIDSEWGYILEVDLQYPNELHDLHNSYPLAPEK